MRSILLHAPYRNFSSNKLSQVIQHTAQNLKQQQGVNYLKYEDIFFKLYTNHLARQKKVSYNIKTIDSMCMLSQFPCKSIVEHFHVTGKAYSQEYTVQTLVRLSRAYKISQADNSSTADFSINRLFFTPAFQNLIQEYKYGLRKQHAMSWDNAFLVAECLIDIGFVDYEVFSILINMVETRLNKQQRNENEIRPFQIQKKDYYVGKHRHTQQNLSNDPEFQAVLKMLSSHVRSHELKTDRRTSLKQLQTELSSTQESQNIYHSILESVSLIESYNQDLTKLIEGILTIRKQYRKMVQLSKSKQILRNPEFNFQLLELQEMLLVKKFISIIDIKSPERIDSQDFQLKRVEQILVSIIEPQGSQQGISTSQIGQFLDTSFTEGQNKQSQRLKKFRDTAQYGRAIATLSRFSEVSRKLYNSPDGRSLISMKWEKTLLLYQKSDVETPQSRQNLHPEKIFRRTFSDLYRMMKRSYSIFMFTFIEAPLRYKIQFFESLARLGFHQQLIHLLESEDSSKERVQGYTNAEFSSLIRILNQVGPKINADHLKKDALKHLSKLYEKSQFQEKKSLFSMQFCTNAINFMCQSCNVVSADMTTIHQSKDQKQILYENLVDKLAQQVKYYDQSDNFLTNDHLYEALRVLSMQRPGQFKLNNNFLARFAVNVQDIKQVKEFLYRKNPFHSIVQQMCQQYGDSPLNNHYPFIQTGFNVKGQLTAVLLCSSDQTSMSGKHVNGNISAYIHRVKRQFSISIQPLAINSLLEIDYDKTFEGRQFAFKPKTEISNLFSSLFKRDQLYILQFSSVISNICSVLEKHYKRSYLYALVKFLNTLNQCVRLFDREKQILSFQLFKFRRCRLFVQLDALKEDYNLIDKSVKEELQKMWKKQTSVLTNQLLRKNPTVIGMVEAIQQAILHSVDAKDKQGNTLTKTLFQGKRFSIETFIQSEQSNNLGVQFINPSTYIDKAFCRYEDWTKAISQVYPLQTIKVSESNNTTKILAKRFLPNTNQQLTLLPFAKKSALQDRTEFTLNSLQPIKDETSAIGKPESALTLSQHQLQQVKQLLSFVHELKISMSQQQLMAYLFAFDFVSQFGQKAEKGAIVQPLPRQYNSYFGYLQARNDKLYLQSPNLEYLFNKLEQREEILEIFNNRTQRKAQVKIQYQLGNLSRKEYLAKVQAVDEQVISNLKTLNRNVLDNVDEYKMLQNGLKMVRIQKDQKQIQRVLNRARYYQRTLDKDFIHVRGNADRCLKIKRSKAEKTLALYKVFYKLSRGQTELIQHDKQLLKKEASLITYRLENKKDHLDSFSERFTTLTVGDLSKADKERLRLGGSDLSRFQKLPLTDIVLELNNLLDTKVYENFEKSIAQKYYSSTHGLPEQIFASSLNKQFSKLAHLQQRVMVKQHSKFDFYELGLLSQMVQTFKTESKTGKQRFAQFYEAFYEDVREMNNSQASVELISQYLNQKELEYAQDYNPKLVTEIKERQVMKLWNIIFKKPYRESDTELIRKTVHKICQRIRLMGDNSPPFFGQLVIKILEHPSTDSLSKQDLISNIEHFKTPLKIDSQDIRSLGFACSNQEKVSHPNSQKMIEQIGLISNKNFMENLNKKINMIV